jgi:hypothetical protein
LTLHSRTWLDLLIWLTGDGGDFFPDHIVTFKDWHIPGHVMNNMNGHINIIDIILNIVYNEFDNGFDQKEIAD